MNRLVPAALILSLVLVVACATGGGGGATTAPEARAETVPPRLDPVLTRIAAAEDRLLDAARHGLVVDDERVLVEIVVAEEGGVPEVRDWLARHGATHTRTWPDRVQSRILPADLEALSTLPPVTIVRRPVRAPVKEDSDPITADRSPYHFRLERPPGCKPLGKELFELMMTNEPLASAREAGMVVTDDRVGVEIEVATASFVTGLRDRIEGDLVTALEVEGKVLSGEVRPMDLCRVASEDEVTEVRPRWREGG